MRKSIQKLQIEQSIADLQREIAEKQALLEDLQWQSGAMGRYWQCCQCERNVFIQGGDRPPSTWRTCDDTSTLAPRHVCPACPLPEWGEWTQELGPKEKRADRRRLKRFIGSNRTLEHWMRVRVFLDHARCLAYYGTKIQLLGYNAGRMRRGERMGEEWKGPWSPDSMVIIVDDQRCSYSLFDLGAHATAQGEAELKRRGIVLY